MLGGSSAVKVVAGTLFNVGLAFYTFDVSKKQNESYVKFQQQQALQGKIYNPAKAKHSLYPLVI